MNERKWSGARWWKFDFHAHTPASLDYGKGKDQTALKARSPREWLLDYMRAGVECVAVTDHNTGEWIDQLKAALAELEEENHADFRPIHLFPGVEISVYGGIHLLAILGREKSASDIASLLGAVKFRGTRGASDDVTAKSLVEVVGDIVSAGGIAIPAHVDENNGLFKQTGTTLAQALDCEGIFALELVDAEIQKPQLFSDKKLHWTEVLGSDSHHPSGQVGQKFPGSRFTWVKMGQPNIEGLRLALLDGPFSVLRSDNTIGDPNRHAGMLLESIEVENARYMGRSRAFALRLNPWMNAIIGGRGTGKSSLVEFLRLALRRDNELPDALKEEFGKYKEVNMDRGGSGLLTENAVIRAVYRKDEATFRIQWDPSGSHDPIQEQTAQGWQRAEGEVQQRFPVRMYSQKQIYQMARDTLALLTVINKELDYASWKSRLITEENQYMSLRARIREIEAGLIEESRLKGERDDVKHKLAVFEKAGHAGTLKALQKRRRQNQAVEAWEAGLEDAGRRLRAAAEEIIPEDLEEASFDETTPEDTELIRLVRQAVAELEEIAGQVKDLAAKADGVFERWHNKWDESLWMKETGKALQDYDELQARLKSEGVADVSDYGLLVQRRQAIENQLKELEGRRHQIVELERQATACLGRVASLRREISERRREFLRETLIGNPYVRISVVPYGSKETVEPEFRNLIGREPPVFEKDIRTPGEGGVLDEIYRLSEDPDAIEAELESMEAKGKEVAKARLIEKGMASFKTRIRKDANNPQGAEVADKRFAGHLANLWNQSPETFDRIDLWFPEDSLEVEYSTSSDQLKFRPIKEASPGQKTAALLAFLLSYGEEPLLLDQPEDDLDNHLIYDLIVAQLREAKRHRQVIVVTHNANIVVNGDAEYVVALTAGGGETRLEADGCLQEKRVRQTICDVMEGGEQAFEQRYRRIALEVRNV